MPTINPALMMELQKTSHLYAAVLDANGALIRQQVIRFTNRFNPADQTERTTQEATGWATFTMFSSSNYDPAAGAQGPWCWAPAGQAETLCGGGRPLDGQSIAVFAVWQMTTAGTEERGPPTPTSHATPDHHTGADADLTTPTPEPTTPAPTPQPRRPRLNAGLGRGSSR